MLLSLTVENLSESEKRKLAARRANLQKGRCHILTNWNRKCEYIFSDDDRAKKKHKEERGTSVEKEENNRDAMVVSSFVAFFHLLLAF